MNKQLQLDAGNTRLKWRLISEENSTSKNLSSGYIANNTDWQIIFTLLIKKLMDDYGTIDAISIATVLGNTQLKILKQILYETIDTKLFVAKVKKKLSGLTIAYPRRDRLGIDRWLAMLAAHTHTPKKIKIVIDCGTAITVDMIDHTGQHQGGYIVPGLRLMQKSLSINTAADLDRFESVAKTTTLGVMTLDCINHGVLAMAVALINDLSAKHLDAIVYMTGGDASDLLQYIKASSVMHIPYLVLDGLKIAFDELS